MLDKIKELKKEIEFLQTTFVLANPAERPAIMMKIIQSQNRLDKLEDEYYFSK